ncbi:MAG: hypothetical protein D4R82_02265 [Dehalococcoidia bacterium]|nr:MAG: hypothetical protein D4R82_02265 [Dehalococcoidia bacterium]
MNREEGRAERKSRKRRLLWLEKECKRDKTIDKIVTALEKNFDEGEIDNAKAFVVDYLDYLTDSGSFSQIGESVDGESLERISGDYSLEPVDSMLILDILEDIFAANEEQDS